MQNNKADLILGALLTHSTVREAAKALSMPESTIYCWLRKPGFKAKYNATKSEMLQQSTLFLQSKVPEAINIVGEIMKDKKTPPQIKVNACRTILEYAVKLTEQVDILPRLETLEKEQN